VRSPEGDVWHCKSASVGDRRGAVDDKFILFVCRYWGGTPLRPPRRNGWMREKGYSVGGR
jgi:hypothetical protein